MRQTENTRHSPDKWTRPTTTPILKKHFLKFLNKD